MEKIIEEEIIQWHASHTLEKTLLLLGIGFNSWNEKINTVKFLFTKIR